EPPSATLGPRVPFRRAGLPTRSLARTCAGARLESEADVRAGDSQAHDDPFEDVVSLYLAAMDDRRDFGLAHAAPRCDLLLREAELLQESEQYGDVAGGEDSTEFRALPLGRVRALLRLNSVHPAAPPGAAAGPEPTAGGGCAVTPGDRAGGKGRSSAAQKAAPANVCRGVSPYSSR